MCSAHWILSEGLELLNGKASLALTPLRSSVQDVFGKDKNPCRLGYGVASLPLGTPVELELIFEVE